MRGKKAAEIDLVKLERLAALPCTIEEAGVVFGCTKRTMLRYLEKQEYRDAWDRGQNTFRLSLRRLQWRHAQGSGSAAVQMTIHLSKFWLGETGKVAA